MLGGGEMCDDTEWSGGGHGNSAKQNHQLCPCAILLLLTTIASDEPQTNKQTHPTTTMHAKPNQNKTKQKKRKQTK